MSNILRLSNFMKKNLQSGIYFQLWNRNAHHFNSREKSAPLLSKATKQNFCLQCQNRYSSGCAEPIKCRAAVAWEPKKLTIEEVEVGAPKKHEVRIKMIATGVCHTDAITLDGDDKDAMFPAILGHEGAGIVESIGEGVTKFKPGDHVIPLFIPNCMKCKLCKSGKTNLCEKIHDVPCGLAPPMGTMWDGTSRFKCKGKTIYHYMGTSTFSEYTVVDDFSMCKINNKAPLDKICLLGCGISTGYGAALNSAKVQRGSTCGVWGLGGVGLACVMGCKRAGAKKIFGIDINSAKGNLSKKFGVTDFVNPKEIECPIQEYLINSTDGGLDYTFESTSNVGAMRQAFESTHVGWGITTIIGVAPSGHIFKAEPYNFIVGRSLIGSAFGGWFVKDIPLLVEQYMKKEILLDEFITQTLCLDEIKKAFDFMHSGKGLRSVVLIGSP